MKNETPRGERVKAVIKSLGISSQTVAKKVGIHRTTMNNYYNTDELSFDIIKKIGNAINYDFSQVFPEMAKEKPWLSIDDKDARIKELEGKVAFFTDETYRLTMAYKKLEYEYTILKNKLEQANNGLQIAAEPNDGWEKKKGA